MSRAGRVEVAGVALLAALMFTMSAVVAFRMPIWSPIDEAAHYATAVGAIHLHYPRINKPIHIPADLPVLLASGQDYQAGGPPFNYLLLGIVEEVTRAAAAGVSRLTAHPLDADRVAVRAMRLSESVLLAALVVLLWLCARVIAPGDLAFAWGVPGSTFLFRGLIIDGSRVSNDILVAVLVTLALWLFLRWRHALSFRRGLLLGIIVGLATESKISGVYAFIPIVLVLLAGAVRGGRPVLRGAVPAGIAAAAAWAVLVVPWFVFQYRRYGDPTGASVVRSVLPHIVWIQPGNPWPAIWSAPPYVWITATLSEVPNPLQVHLAAFNFGVQNATLAVLLAGAVGVILSRRLGGLTRPERLALGLSAPLMFVLLAVLSVKAGYSFLGDARDEFPAMLPFTFIVAAPLLLSRTRLPAPVAGGVLALWSGFALLSTVILTLPWNWG